MESGEEEEDRDWCRFEYEFLPDFCYTCGIIGHGEKDCATKVKKGERSQFGRWLRADIGQHRAWQRRELGGLEVEARADHAIMVLAGQGGVLEAGAIVYLGGRVIPAEEV